MMQYSKYSKLLKNVTYLLHLNASAPSLLTPLYPKSTVIHAQVSELPTQVAASRKLEHTVQELNTQSTNLNLIRKVVAASSEMSSLKHLSTLQNPKLQLDKTFTTKASKIIDRENPLSVSQFVKANSIKPESHGPSLSYLYSQKGEAPTSVGASIQQKPSASFRTNKSLKFFINKIYAKPLSALNITKQKKPLVVGKTSANFTLQGLKPATLLFLNTKSGLEIHDGASPTLSLVGSKNMVNNLAHLNKTVHKFKNAYSKLTEINLITINLASANRIRQWAEKTLPNGKVVGEVINPETIHYKTLKPIKGGLFCERIFGPLKDHECACGKKFNIKNYLSKTVNNSSTQPLIDSLSQTDNQLSFNLQKRYFCRICDVEYTYSIMRRTQLGYIQLASPTTHVWFVKGIPSYISILLDMKKKHLQGITYNTETLTLENSFRGRQLLPVSPSSIFESWQKIMKTQYPEKYNLTNAPIQKGTSIHKNPLNYNMVEEETKTNITGNKMKFAYPEGFNLSIRKGIKTKKPKTKKTLYKQHLKKYYGRNPQTYNQEVYLHEGIEGSQSALSSFRSNNQYLNTPQKVRSLDNKPTKSWELKSLAKMQYILSRKGWFKLIKYVLKEIPDERASLSERPSFSEYKKISQGGKTQIFLLLNDNVSFFQNLLGLRSPTFLIKYLKDLDSRNPDLELMSINTILKFSAHKLPEIYKNVVLKQLKMQEKSLVTPLYMLIFVKDQISPPLQINQTKLKETNRRSQMKFTYPEGFNPKKTHFNKGNFLNNGATKYECLYLPSFNSLHLLKKVSVNFNNLLMKFYSNQWKHSNKQNVLARNNFLQEILKTFKKSTAKNITLTNLNNQEFSARINHLLWSTKLHTKKELNPLFILTTSLKSDNWNVIEKNLNQISLMLLLNLVNKKDKNLTKPQIKDYLAYLTKVIKVWPRLTANVKTKFLLKLVIYATFSQPLGFIKEFNFLKNQKAYQSIKSIKNYVKLPFYTMNLSLFGELDLTTKSLKSKNLFGSLYYCSSLKMLKIFTLFFFFLKKTKKQVIYKLYTSILADLKKLKHQYFRSLMVSFTLFSYKKHLNVISPLTTLLLQLSQHSSLHEIQMVKKTQTIFSLNGNPEEETNLHAMLAMYFNQNIKVLCAKFYTAKVKNSLLDSKILNNLIVLSSATNLDRFTKKGQLSVKGSNIYFMQFSETLIKVKMWSSLSFAKLIKQGGLAVETPGLQKYNSQNLWSSIIECQSSFIEMFSLPQNLIINNIYCLSHRELWEQDKDWQDFAYYYYSPGRITDRLIPLYKSRNYDTLFSIDNTLSNTPQTEIYSLGMNINTAFSGAGLIQKLLNDFNFTELKKMDKQNRILLFQYNKHVQKLKKVMGTSSKGINTGNRKSRYQYYKACHIRDVLIRRTKLTRKIFNKLIPNDNFKRVDEQLTFKLASSSSKKTSSKATAFSNEANKTSSMVNRDGVSKLQAIQNTTETNGLNMILTLLPVLPPVLRPVLKMSGQFTISDLNRLYQRIIYRNERLKKFLKDPALSSSFEMKYAQRLLQEAVDNLIQNGKSGVVPEKDARGRLLKSLSDILKGKQGRFRQYLLGKRVDYSGRSVIVVGPRLRLHECGIPKEMALVLYSPFLIKRILNEKLADTYLSAKKLIQTNPLLVSQLLREIMKSCPVLLNRAPTLHRLGFQAFQPKLVDGKAILLHPLVCPAFNADFDGDQMAVHVPITFEARAEAWKLMLARNNLLSPATGEPLILPSQDMVLGCYYLTTNCAEKWSKLKKGSGMYFHNIHEVLKAYNQQLVHLHAVIWVNIKGYLETGNAMEQPLEIRIPFNQKYLYSQQGSSISARYSIGGSSNRVSGKDSSSYYSLAERQWQLSLDDHKYAANNLINQSTVVNLPNINIREREVNTNILNLTNVDLNYLEIYSKAHNFLNLNQNLLITHHSQITDNNMHLPQLTTQIIRTTPGKILFNILVKNAIEKRPKLLNKSNFKGGFIKNKLVNAIDSEIDNSFLRKNPNML